MELDSTMYFVYIIRCLDNSLYTGITTDLTRRFREHKEGIGSHYTRARGVKKIIYSEKQKNRSSASKRESEIKKMTKKMKLGLLSQQ